MRAAELARRRPIWLAGGLADHNVGEAIRLVRPGLVDVSSGVESAPGVKDRERLRAFFAAVTRACEEME
jgi:phosphoribosylanthranilate isomerase